MKELIHLIALVCALIWLIGFFKYEASDEVHFFLLTAVLATITRVLMEKQAYKKLK